MAARQLRAARGAGWDARSYHRAMATSATVATTLVDRSERGKLGFVGPDAAVFLNGQVTNDVEALAPGEGCYAALLTNKGKMLGRPARCCGPRTGVLLDCERVALQDVFDVLRRAVVGWRVELVKRTVQEALVAVDGPEARRLTGAGDLPEAEHAHRPAALGGAAVRLVATDRGVDVLCAAEDAGRRARRPAGGRGRRGRGGRGRGRPRGGRAPALRRRPRRHRHPPGGGAQRARRELHEGVLRRAGDGRAPALPGQAEPPPARPAPQRAAARRARRCASATARSAG